VRGHVDAHDRLEPKDRLAQSGPDGGIDQLGEAPIGGAMEAVADKDVAAALNAWATWSQDWPSVSLRSIKDGEDQGEAEQA
jgi:hypothetical protein